MNNVPEKIYLQIGSDCCHDVDFNKLVGVTWNKDRINRNDVEYVRADLLKWNKVEECFPEKKLHKKPQPNGNILTFFDEYLVKGYYNGNPENIGIELAAYKIPQFSSVVGWHFNVPRNFTVTEWKPIN